VQKPHISFSLENMGKTLSPSGDEIAGKRNQGQGNACGFVAVTFPCRDLDIRDDNSPCDIHRLWFSRGLEADALRR